MNAANVTVYALTISCSALTPPPIEAPIDLTATLTTLTSSWTTQKPRLNATSVSRRAPPSAARAGWIGCLHCLHPLYPKLDSETFRRADETSLAARRAVTANYSVPPGPETRIRSRGEPGTGGAPGGSITWLANMPPPSTVAVIPSGMITVTVPKKLNTLTSTTSPWSVA